MEKLVVPMENAPLYGKAYGYGKDLQVYPYGKIPRTPKNMCTRAFIQLFLPLFFNAPPTRFFIEHKIIFTN